LAVAKISSTALSTRTIVASVPAHAYTLAFSPRGNAGSQFVDYAGNLMSRHTRILNPRPKTFFG
jgi:hypothetical protein